MEKRPVKPVFSSSFLLVTKVWLPNFNDDVDVIRLLLKVWNTEHGARVLLLWRPFFLFVYDACVWTSWRGGGWLCWISCRHGRECNLGKEREKLCLSKHRHRRRIALEQFPSFPYALTRFVGAPFSLSLSFCKWTPATFIFPFLVEHFNIFYDLENSVVEPPSISDQGSLIALL